MTTPTIPEPVQRLVEAFSRLPGIGPKTASRLTYYLLRQPPDEANSLADALHDLKARTRFCEVCFNITEDSPCPICKSDERDRAVICVVEEPLDVMALERTGSFKGRYHVLHGVISPREGIGPEDLKVHELIERVRLGDITELILGTNPGLEGDNTAYWIKRELEANQLSDSVKLTRLARGLPTGADLEYADSVTLMRALQGRQAL